MGTIDELRDSLGDDFFLPRADRPEAHAWHELCPCGHLRKAHSPDISGTYRLFPSREVTRGRETYTETQVMHGCNGALAARGFDKLTPFMDRDAHTITSTVNVTCPCTEFRAVARVDRPNRMFNQKTAIGQGYGRHPFQLGMKALRTFLGNRKAAQTNPTWADEEFDRRFEWLPGKRRCAISRCEETEDVWACYINDETSELRCAAHR